MQTAFVLESDELAGSESFTFPGFPGVWTAGTPIEADEFVKAGSFGSVGEMRDRVVELGLPLSEVEVAAGSAPMPRRDNHLYGDEGPAAEPARPRFATHAEANARAAELGLEFAERSPALAAKTALIEQAEQGGSPSAGEEG